MVKIFNFEKNTKEFSANTYIVGKVGGNCVIVDFGSTDDEVLDYIDAHYEKISAILLTHGHFDHIRGLNKLLKRYRGKYDIPVYLHPEDEDLLMDMDGNASLPLGEKVQITGIEPISVNDGDTIALKGFNITVIHTPFHTKGSVCYLFEDENALFTGDTLFKDGIGRFDFSNSQPEKIQESLKKLVNLRDTLVIYPGHGPITRLAAELESNPYLKDMK